jgi:hypothetical protein
MLYVDTLCSLQTTREILNTMREMSYLVELQTSTILSVSCNVSCGVRVKNFFCNLTG